MSVMEAQLETRTLPTPSQTDGGQGVAPVERLDDLARIIRAYNDVTDKLQRSHEALHQEVARLQHELSGANAQLQRSKRLAALGEMAAGIAHEIRNPLAAIQLYAGMIAEDLESHAAAELSPQIDTARKIAGAVRGLNAIVCDVLSFAREIRPTRAIASIAELFERAVDANLPALDAADVDVVFDDTLDDDASVIAIDGELMHQALVNLIRNAVDAMSSSPPRVLSLSMRREDGNIVLVIRDSGPGIAEADIDRIFNPFFTTRNTGTGLGLAIVHRIVDAHGGSISVFNDNGAVFEVRIPSHAAEGEHGSAA